MKNTHLTTDILILGAGIGGYETFRTLSKLLKKNKIDKKIMIVDKNNYFTFVPMMHEVATGSIEPTHAAIPLRELVYKTPHQFMKATVTGMNLEQKTVQTDMGNISYDHCVIALGSKTNYFNTPGAEEYSYHVRSLEGALRLKHDFIVKLDNCSDDRLEINVVGGGYTGIEVAGQYCDLVHKDIKKLYPEKEIIVRVIQSGDKILPYMPSEVQDKVEKKLIKDQVQILKNNRVTEVQPNQVILKDGTKLRSDLTIWTAGFANLGTNLVNEEMCNRGRIIVTNELTIPEYEHTYTIGDISCITNEEQQILNPQLAEAAHKQGEYVAHHLLAILKNKKYKKFFFKAKGALMPVGDWYGVAVIGPITLFGKFAWWIRRTVYLLFMPGFQRKLRIVFDWTLHGFGFRHFINVSDDEEK